METSTVFVSVGATANPNQEMFVEAVEQRLRSEGLIPHTVGRNTFSSEAPLNTVTEMLDKASGVVVIALERSFFPSGTEKRGGPKEAQMANVKLATPWNQIEAAMAYAKGLPLLVIVEAGLKSEGLLEHGYGWYVQWIEPTPSALSTPEFNGVLASWKKKVEDRAKHVSISPALPAPKPIADLTIGELIAGLRPAHLWSLLGALAALVAASITAGAQLKSLLS